MTDTWDTFWSSLAHSRSLGSPVLWPANFEYTLSTSDKNDKLEERIPRQNACSQFMRRPYVSGVSKQIEQVWGEPMVGIRTTSTTKQNIGLISALTSLFFGAHGNWI